MYLQSGVGEVSVNAVTWGLATGTRLEGHADVRACVAVEEPVGLIYAGIPYAVMMATPADLTDFAIGFSVTEGFIEGAAGIIDVEARQQADGLALDIRLAPEALTKFLRRRRLRALRAHTSCGLCGIEDLKSLAVPPSQVRPAKKYPSAQIIGSAFHTLRSLQPLSCSTRGAHAAAWCGFDGVPLIVREDVGRHNALDKLIGACIRTDCDFSAGFLIITSRCSFEMVHKAVAAGISLLASVAAPTALAIKTARDSGLTLICPDTNHQPTVYANRNDGQGMGASECR